RAPPEGLTARRRETLELLAAAPAGIPTPALAARGISADTVSRLVQHGLVAVRYDRVERDPFARTNQGQIGVGSGSDPDGIRVGGGSEEGQTPGFCASSVPDVAEAA